MPEVSIRRVRAEDWRAVRDLRLRMLLDEPKAYLERHDDARRLDDAAWQARAQRATQPGKVGLVAEHPDGTWIGTMTVIIEAPGRACLVAVFVEPEARGGSVADALLDAAAEWSRHAGATTLRLLVHADNLRARAFYRRRGFLETGHTEPYELDPSETEIEMLLTLSPPDGAHAEPSR